MSAEPSFTEQFDDPRITAQFCRYLSGPSPLVLVGVVHDHPASIARVKGVLEAVNPDTVALELPPAAVPLYRTYAREPADQLQFGGEMTAAIRTATTDTDGSESHTESEIVGIDGPNWSIVRRLCSRVLADRVAPSTARRLLSSLSGATRTAVTCRVAATLSNATSMTVSHDDPIEYDCSPSDQPSVQATHERRHVAGVRLFLQQGDDSTATAYRDEAREACMVEHLESLSEDGSVVAVVGIDHLDPLEQVLSGRSGVE